MSDATQTWYPSFRAGQVVTAEELNGMRDYLLQRHRIRSRLLDGFGIVEGLTGSMDPEGGLLIIQPGTAVDARGHTIAVTSRIELDPCDFDEAPRGEPASIRPTPGLHFDSVTPVLVHREQHSTDSSSSTEAVRGTQVIDGHEVVFVRGRLSPPEEPLAYQLRPLRLPRGLRIARTKEFRTRFEELRDALLCIFEEAGIRPHTAHILANQELSSALDERKFQAADTLRIAALNDLLYCAWQLARTQQYQRVHGANAESLDSARDINLASGIALGWMVRHPELGWIWDGRWRQAFSVGLSRLEHDHDYPVDVMRAVCLRRAEAVLDGLTLLRPMQQPGQPMPDAAVSVLDRRVYRSGTGAWMRGIGWDRPRRWTALWPLDPLRGSSLAPRAAVPEELELLETEPHSFDVTITHLSPSLLDPVNDPYAFSSYGDNDRVDPLGIGVLRLVGLLGHPLEQVRRQLRAIYKREQIDPAPLGEAISMSDTSRCGALEFCMVASLGTPLYPVLAPDEQTVAGFACPTTDVGRAAMTRHWIRDVVDEQRVIEERRKRKEAEAKKRRRGSIWDLLFPWRWFA